MNLLCEDGFAMLKEDGDNILWADAASTKKCAGAGFGGGGMVR